MPSTNRVFVDNLQEITTSPAPAGDNTIGRVKITDGVDVADVVDLATYNGLAVAVVDSSGNQITSFGSVEQHATNEAYTDADLGMVALVVRDDALAALTEADGDYSVLRVNATGSLWVAGTVDLGATDNAVLDAIAASVAAIDTDTSTLLTTTAHDAAFGTAGTADAQVRSIQGIASMTPVQVSQATASNLNVTEASAGAILTAVQLIDDTVYVDDTATHATGTSKGIGIMGVAVPTDTAISANDIGMVAMTLSRGLHTSIQEVPRSMMGPAQPGTAVDSYTHAAFNLAAGADQVLAASAANKQIWVYGIGFTTNVAGTVSFQDEDNTAITGIMPFAANSGMAIAPSGNFSMPIWKLATDKDLEVDVVTAELDGWVDYAILSV